MLFHENGLKANLKAWKVSFQPNPKVIFTLQGKGYELYSVWIRIIGVGVSNIPFLKQQQCLTWFNYNFNSYCSPFTISGDKSIFITFLSVSKIYNINFYFHYQIQLCICPTHSSLIGGAQSHSSVTKVSENGSYQSLFISLSLNARVRTFSFWIR